LGDFYVDISAIKAELGWTPPFSLEEGIRRTYGLDE
jgi:nucleoside-diphosphate-sugar epimerase